MFRNWKNLVLIIGFALPAFGSVQLPASAKAVKSQSVNKCKILIMRHAERPGDSTVPDLTAAGTERSEKLVRFILDKYGKPDYIFAAALFRKNNRPQLTVEPLSKETGVPIDASIEAIHNDFLANELLHDKKFNHKLVVISWHHTQIPKLVKALNVPPGEHMKEWDMNTYNLIFEVDLNGSKPPAIRKVIEPF